MVFLLKFFLIKILSAFLVIGLFFAGSMYPRSTKPGTGAMILGKKVWFVKLCPVLPSNANSDFRAYDVVKAMRYNNLQMTLNRGVEFVSIYSKDGAILKKGEILLRLFKTSLEAQFLITMATTIRFGLAITSMLVLFVVPAMIGVGGDICSVVRRKLRCFGTVCARRYDVYWKATNRKKLQVSKLGEA